MVGVKFSTNGSRIDAEVARRLATMDYVDVQISIDGADAARFTTRLKTVLSDIRNLIL